MALNICIELFWKFLFGLIKYIIDNPIYVLLLFGIIISVTKKFGPLIIGLIATAADFLKDTIDIGTLGISSPVTILIGLGIGLLWATMAFSPTAPLLLSLSNAIPMFLFGTLLGIAPIPFLSVLSLGVGYSLEKFTIPNYLIGIISGVLIYFVLSFGISILSGFCKGLNFVVNLF
jgi:hypothetical protein